MKTGEKKSKKDGFRNIRYALRLVAETCPAYIPVALIGQTVTMMYRNFFSTVIILKSLMSLIENGNDYTKFAEYLLLFAALSFVCRAVDSFMVFFQMLSIKKSSVKLTRTIFRKASEMDISLFENPDFYDTYQRATQTANGRDYFSVVMGFSTVVSTLITSVSVITYILSLDWRLLLLSSLGIVSFLFRRKRIFLNREMRKETTPFFRTGDYAKRTVMIKDYSKDMRLGNIFDVVISRYREATEDIIRIYRDYGFKLVVISILNGFLTDTVPTAAAYALAGVKYAVKHTISMGDFSVAISAVSSLKTTIFAFFASITRLEESAVSMSFLRDFLEFESPMKEGNRILEKIENIEYRNVSFTYSGNDSPSLKNINLKINSNETVAIVGMNGAGKSTFVKLLLRFYDVTEGEILINGINIKEYTFDSLRNQISTVFQDYKVFALSVEENVLCRASSENDEKILDEALKKSGIIDKINSLPKKEKSILTKEFDNNGVSLSGGEQQKIAVSRMFARDYSLAILDEPSSALDAKAEYEMYENIVESTKDKTVIFISHRLSSATLSDRIYVFENGCISEYGTHSQLMESNGKYAELFNLQASNYREEGETE